VLIGNRKLKKIKNKIKSEFELKRRNRKISTREKCGDYKNLNKLWISGIIKFEMIYDGFFWRRCETKI